MSLRATTFKAARQDHQSIFDHLLKAVPQGRVGAQALGFTQQNVRVVTPYVGGGFGGKSASRQAVEAARLAKITGKPVQVAFDRAEEFFL